MAGRQGRRWLARAWGLALLLLMLLAPAGADALEWRLPGRGAAPLSRPGGESNRRQLQEVSPPVWVQKARLALEDRDPSVRILAPADGELLPEGPWTLRLQVGDWPLVDAGPLGLGPHLVVQLDEEPPRPTVDTTVEMPPLSPGSHRLTVYAAKPWGEAHKSPLARQQIRLHRLAPNPATLPAPGTPQLIPVSPSGAAGSPPLLVDWLLIDAPLQGLRGDTSGWRLRLTVNGESVLLDQQTPLWLQGWTPGANGLLLELLDGRGEPLNAPYNSLLREVVVSAGGAAPSRPRALTDLELAVLLGDQPVSVLTPPAPVATPTEPPTEAPAKPPAEPATEPAPDQGSRGASEGPAAPEPPASPDLTPMPERLVSPAVSPAIAPETAAAVVSPAPSPEEAAESPEPPARPDTKAAPEREASPAVQALPALEAAPTVEAVPTAPTETEDATPAADAPAPADDQPPNERPEALVTRQDPPRPPDAPVSPAAPLPSTAPDTIPTAQPPTPAAPSASSEPASTGAALAAPAPAPAASPAEPSPAERPAARGVAPPDPVLDRAAAEPPLATPKASAPATPSARDELNADGTLRRPPRPSALEWLRERLG